LSNNNKYMLTLTHIRDNRDLVIDGLTKKGITDATTIIDTIITYDKGKREYQKKIDDNKAIVNSNSKRFGQLMKENATNELEKIKIENSNLNHENFYLKEDMEAADKMIYKHLIKLPNLPHESVPVGKSADDNEVVRYGGSIPALPNNAVPHWDLIKQYELVDFELGNKITGKGYPVYKNEGAKLQRALINFFLSEAEDAGYKEVQVPILVNKDSGYATGQLPDKDGQMYHVTEDGLYVIPTAEVPITNIYRDTLLKPEQLPVKHVGYTPCFRREAGSWGADTRGLNRLHQFDKVEIVQIVNPEESYQVLEEMVLYVESLLIKLDLPYRILRLCSGDMSFTSALTYDFEVFSVAQNKWLEVSSVSNFETFQANRLKLRTKQGLLHTLNGSALALPRILAAILENNQTEDGINIPSVLHPYLRFTKI
jgi:seryl-tRNA synthetase